MCPPSPLTPPQAPEICGDPLSDLGPALPPRCPCVPPLRAPAAVLAPGAGKTPPPHKKNAEGGERGIGVSQSHQHPNPPPPKNPRGVVTGCTPKKNPGYSHHHPKSPPKSRGGVGVPPPSCHPPQVKWPSVSALDKAAAPPAAVPVPPPGTLSPPRGHRRSASCGSTFPPKAGGDAGGGWGEARGGPPHRLPHHPGPHGTAQRQPLQEHPGEEPIPPPPQKKIGVPQDPQNPGGGF